jgi:KUP system potassium uptake protein
VPHALLHNLKHNKVLHERVMLLTVEIEDVPFVAAKRGSRPRIRRGFFRIDLRYGFMEEIDVPGALARSRAAAAVQDDGHQLLPRAPDADRLAGPAWRSGARKLFAWMLRNAESAMEFFKLPTNRWWNWAARSRSRRMAGR